MMIATLGAISSGASVRERVGGTSDGKATGEGEETGGDWETSGTALSSPFVVSAFPRVTDLEVFLSSAKLSFCFLVGKHMGKNRQEGERRLCIPRTFDDEFGHRCVVVPSYTLKIHYDGRQRICFWWDESSKIECLTNILLRPDP